MKADVGVVASPALSRTQSPVSEKTHQPADDASLDTQLDSLLARIEREDSGAIPEEASHPAPASDDSLDAMIDRQVDDAITAAESAMAHAVEIGEPRGPAVSESTIDAGDDLAEQVQAMLDEAASQSSAAPALDADTDGERIEAIDGELSGSFKAPEAITGVAPAASGPAAPPDPAAFTDADEAGGLDELDRLLAEEADEAIAGDFESPQDVSSASPVVEEPALGEAFAEADEALAGTFEAPEAAGTAAAVAHELDEQPEQAVPAAAARAVPVDEHGSSAVPAMLSRFERAARHACAAVNSPLNHLSAEWRNTVGYAGLLITLTSIVLILAATLF